MLSPPNVATAERGRRFEELYAAHHVPLLGYALRRTVPGSWYVSAADPWAPGGVMLEVTKTWLARLLRIPTLTGCFPVANAQEAAALTADS